MERFYQEKKISLHTQRYISKSESKAKGLFYAAKIISRRTGISAHDFIKNKSALEGSQAQAVYCVLGMPGLCEHSVESLDLKLGFVYVLHLMIPGSKDFLVLTSCDGSMA